jgi:16S rRNA (uracil1498-N3)-methyltransferase
MRIPRIYSDQLLEPDLKITLEPEAARHIIQVLRLRTGAEIELFNGDGYNYAARLESAAKKQAQAEVISRSGPEADYNLYIHLCLAISKGERMDFAIQKSVELGVSEITPLFSQRCVINLQGERLHKREQHWRKVILSACEQSGRCRVPILNSAVELPSWLETSHQGTGLVLDPKSETGIGSIDKPADKITILIGPEGGLSEAEIASAKTRGFKGISLGPRILRTETAPLAAIASMQTLWGDFR